MKKLHIIWQDAIYENEDDWKDAYKEYCEIHDEEPSDDGLHAFISGYVSEYYEDEAYNLKKEIPQGIIAIADLGLWYGRSSGYREIGTNLSDCLKISLSGYGKYYIEDDFMLEDSHHDGTNYITFRKWKDGVTEERKETLKIKLAGNEDAKGLIEELTESLREDIAKIYGWED